MIHTQPAIDRGDLKLDIIVRAGVVRIGGTMSMSNRRESPLLIDGRSHKGFG